MQKKSKKICFILVVLFSAANIFAQTNPSAIIENSLRAIGGSKDIEKVRNLWAFADCRGPNGSYTTEIYSARNGKLIFKQVRGANTFIGQSNAQMFWTKDEKTDDFSLADNRAAMVWRSHDFQFLALEIGARFKDFAFAGEEKFVGKLALKLKATDELGNPASIFFDKETHLLLGITIQNPFDKNETIRTTFNEWRQIRKLKLPAKITATDEKGDFVLNFKEIILNKTDEKVFAVPAKVTAMNEILSLLKQARVAHFTRNAKMLVSTFADDFSSISNGKISKPTREAGLSRFQNYLNNSTFIEWDDITPPIIKVSDDASMAYALVHKKVRLVAKNESGKEEEETEIFAWAEIYRKIKGEWKLTAVISTNTPENDPK
jgi:hypothetical protein